MSGLSGADGADGAACATGAIVGPFSGHEFFDQPAQSAGRELLGIELDRRSGRGRAPRMIPASSSILTRFESRPARHAGGLACWRRPGLSPLRAEPCPSRSDAPRGQSAPVVFPIGIMRLRDRARRADRFRDGAGARFLPHHRRGRLALSRCGLWAQLGAGLPRPGRPRTDRRVLGDRRAPPAPCREPAGARHGPPDLPHRRSRPAPRLALGRGAGL